MTGLSFAYEGYNPGGPTGTVLDWFHDWICTSDATTSTDWFVPLYIPRARAEEWHFRFASIASAFHLSAGGFTWNYTRSMTRRFTSGLAIANERDLFKPGIIASDSYSLPADSPTTYSLALNDDGWNGPGSTLDLTLQVELFGKKLLGGSIEIPHMIWQQDGTLILPSLHITGSFVASSPGTDFGFFFSNNPSGSIESRDVDLFTAHGGSTIDIHFTSTSHTIDSWSLDFDPNLWFEWGGKWDAATGARV